MHPHLYLTTKPSPATRPGPSVALPVNCVREYVLHTHNSSFGDLFTLNARELGGPAKGRSHVMGRAQIQFGPETGGCAPVACWLLGPGGVLAEPGLSPVSLEFPGRLSPGALGYYEMLRFPLRTYALDDLAVISDSFEISIGLADRQTGRFLHPLLHRGFINQDLIFALLRVEPRTPRESFFFRGPARFDRGPDSALLFRFEGDVRLPFPDGYLFPKPDLSMAYRIGPDSVLDPFLWLQARPADSGVARVFERAEEQVVSSTGDVFSYEVSLGGPAPRLVYRNHSQEGAFQMHSLTWAAFSNSRFGESSEQPDTVTVSGFGVWRKDGTATVQPVAAQFCTATEAPFVGIQVGPAEVSNVNTRPADERIARP